MNLIVDKVIDDLKSKAFITGEESNDDGCYTDGRFYAVPLGVAIEIVKNSEKRWRKVTDYERQKVVDFVNALEEEEKEIALEILERWKGEANGGE